VQIHRELQTLIAFINAIDRQGHRIPEDTQVIRSQIRALNEAIGLISKERIKEWPPVSLLSMLALAQHYGVPTRMLDWSLDPYVAAYFAAVSAAMADSTVGGDLVVWAVSKSLFEVNEIMVEESSKIERLPIHFVSVGGQRECTGPARRFLSLSSI
jgi:hypothetical protein